jgi:putative ABC transport system permease protein
VPVGFEPAHLLTMQVQAAGRRFEDDAATDRFFEEVLAAVRQVPGVTAAALTSQLPLSGDLDEYGLRREGETAGNNTLRYAVSPGYFATMRIPILHGRALDAHDVAEAPPVAILNESFAKRLFGERDPIGQRVEIGAPDGPRYRIVGIAGDVRHLSLAVSEADAVYMTGSQWRFPDQAMSLVIRAHGDAGALAPAVRAAVWSVDKDQPVLRVSTMDDLLSATAGERRFVLILFEAFALAALVLAAAGIYGVVSGSVAERTREIGVRSALGATRGRIIRLMLHQGMRLVVVGILLGIAGSVPATRSLAAMIFGVSRLDPVTYAGVTLLLTSVSLIACGIPAWRAARVDPASTLRAE